MTARELEELLGAPFEEGCGGRWGELILTHELIGEAMDLALGPRGVVPFRAAYALERAFLIAPRRLAPWYGRLAADYAATSHPSVWRHYGKIVAGLLSRGTLALDGAQATVVAEAALDRLTLPGVPVGARVWSIDILHHLHGRVGWIDRELPEVIDSLSIDPSPAMVSRLRRYGWIGR